MRWFRNFGVGGVVSGSIGMFSRVKEMGRAGRGGYGEEEDFEYRPTM